jgi:hypothetical protein
LKRACRGQRTEARTRYVYMLPDSTDRRKRHRVLYKSLPELRVYGEVRFDVDHSAWDIFTGTLKLFKMHRAIPLFIKDCPVYVMLNWQKCVLPNPSPGMEDVWRDLHPHIVARKENVWFLQIMFSTSIGVRIHKWGFVEILHENEDLSRGFGS